MSWFRRRSEPRFKPRSKPWPGYGALVLLIALTACGFRPLYGPQAGYDSSLAELASVAVSRIPDRMGQILQNDLRDRLTPRGAPANPRYRLGVSMLTLREGVAFEKDESVTRFNITVSASYQLIEIATGSVLSSGATRSVAAFNVVQSEFANISAEADAERRAALAVGENIWIRLGVYFAKVNDERATARRGERG
ncbi:MAG: LPS assembly lipoprotein LptE [Gammaproteobacteria bacterium]|nr:LPS assembly lipoprotein LptE [Gammaproteobacteria bacterium]